MIKWITCTKDNIEFHDVNNRKWDFVYVDTRYFITFTRSVLTTHFALKTEYMAILPKEGQ